jgi:uncharacterized protein
MYYVDSHAHMETLTWENLRSMYLAGIRLVVSPAHLGAAKALNANTIRDIWDFNLEVQIPRVNSFLISGYAMLGISMVSTPKSNLQELLEYLSNYLKRSEVVGLGEIGIEPTSKTTKDLDFQEKIVREQLKILKKLSKMVIFHTTLASEDKLKYTAMMLSLCNEYGIPMSRVVVDHCTEINIGMVLEAGAFAAISVQPHRGITPEKAAELVIKYDYKKIIINSDCSHKASNPLAVPEEILSNVVDG